MAETEDLVQETVFNAVRNLQHLDFKHEDSLKAYMRQAVRNRLRDEIKRAGRRPAAHPLLESDRSDDPSPREVAIAREDLLRCRAALARLPATDRRLILLRLSGGGSFRRLAALSGKPSANAARVALSRALARLAAEMHRLES